MIETMKVATGTMYSIALFFEIDVSNFQNKEVSEMKLVFLYISNKLVVIIVKMMEVLPLTMYFIRYFLN